MTEILATLIEREVKPPPQLEPATVTDVIAAYPKKYHQLLQDMLQNGDAVARNYESLARRYQDMAKKVREQALSGAKNHIDDLMALDSAEEAIARHWKHEQITNGSAGNGSAT